MHENMQAPSGQDLPPSLLATPARGPRTDRDETEVSPGILDVIGQGHRPRAAGRPHGPRKAMAGIALLGLLGWAVWMAMPSETDGLGSGRAAMSAPVTIPPNPSGHPGTVAETTPSVPASEPARIEQVVLQTQAQTSLDETPAEVQRPATESPPTSAARTVGSSHQASPTRTTTAASSRRSAATVRPPDPDVEVIEVLLSRTATAPTARATAGERRP